MNCIGQEIEMEARKMGIIQVMDNDGDDDNNNDIYDNDRNVDDMI